jgi:hypothetical protein
MREVKGAYIFSHHYPVTALFIASPELLSAPPIASFRLACCCAAEIASDCCPALVIASIAELVASGPPELVGIVLIENPDKVLC